MFGAHYSILIYKKYTTDPYKSFRNATKYVMPVMNREDIGIENGSPAVNLYCSSITGVFSV